MTDRALCLDIARHWNGLRVTLLERGPKATGFAPLGYELFSPEMEDVERVTEELEFLLGRANLVGELGAPAGEEIVRLSTLLFDALLPPSVKEPLRRGEGSLTLRIDTSLEAIPWELLHDGGAFLTRRYALARQLMAEGIGAPPPRRPSGEEKEVLVIADPRGDLPAAAREGDVLREALAWREDAELTYVASALTRSELRAALREHDIVHLAGHAESDEDGDGWLLADGRFTAQDVGRLKGTRAMPAMVFANGCTSGTRAGEPDSIVRALLDAGVRHFIGTTWDIPDDIGILFAAGFYERLLDGETVGEAMRQTRVALAERYGEGTALWGSYVLYGDPDVCYFGSPRSLRDTAHADSDLIAASMPGRRTIPSSQMPGASPIRPDPTLRSAEPPPSVVSLQKQVVRMQRSAGVFAALALVIVFSILLALAL